MTTLPEKIGHYRIEDWLGAGGMGEVYRARDERLDRAVALKRITPDGADPARARRLARREARAVAKLSHAAIVQVHDLVEDETGDWLVMELVEGRSLRQVLTEVGPSDVDTANRGPRNRALAPGRVIEIGMGIAAGLGAAHAARLIHRDLKVENVMLTPAGEVKVLDFGIARQLPDAAGVPVTTTLAGPGRIVGTVSAMSPEQAMGDPVDHRSDLFSLGSLLYELLTGVSPFLADSRVETLSRICCHREIPVNERDPAIPPGLADLIGRLLEKAPAHRPQQASEVIAALERLGDGTTDRSIGTAPADRLGSRQEPFGIEGAATAAWGLDSAVLPAMGDVPQAASVTGLQQPGSQRRFSWRAALLGATLVTVLIGWMASTRSPTAPRASADRSFDFETLTSHQLFARGMEWVKHEYRQGSVDRGIEAFQRMIERDGPSAPAYAGLARAYWRHYTGGSKDRLWLERALPAAERAVGIDSFSKPARIARGLVYAEAGRTADAEADFRHVQSLTPEDPDALYGLAHLATLAGDLQQAEALYLRALTVRPDDWELHLLLGVIYYRLARYTEAEAAFTRCLEQASDNIVAYRNLSAVYYQRGAIAQAEEALQRALEIRPMGSLYNNLAILYFSQGLYEQAVAASEKAVQMPGGANHYLHWANLGDAYRWSAGQEVEAQRAFLRATQLLREKLEANPENVTARSRLAVYYAKLGARDAALTEAAAVASVPGTSTTVRFRLTLVYELCGQREQALEALEQALRAGHSLQDVKSDPELLDLREDPRYHRLAALFEEPLAAAISH